jgi:hypothetical protein
VKGHHSVLRILAFHPQIQLHVQVSQYLWSIVFDLPIILKAYQTIKLFNLCKFFLYIGENIPTLIVI